MSIAINVEFLLGLGLAVLVNRNFKGQKLYRTIILTPMMISPAVVGLNFKFLFNDLFGLFNNLLFLFRLIDKPIAWLIDPALAIFSIIITDIWQYTPFMMLILYAGLQALPREPYEAALVDGASSWQIFTKITIPLLRPVILIALTIRSLDIARLFDIIMIMTGGGPAHRTEVMGTYVFRLAIQDRMFGYGNAMAYISILITIAFVAYLFKQLKATKLER
ncbi:MAG: sugar ABC transporter permease [Nitrososphaerales archaeon]